MGPSATMTGKPMPKPINTFERVMRPSMSS
jgi:hypothetical protein